MSFAVFFFRLYATISEATISGYKGTVKWSFIRSMELYVDLVQ